MQCIIFVYVVLPAGGGSTQKPS